MMLVATTTAPMRIRASSCCCCWARTPPPPPFATPTTPQKPSVSLSRSGWWLGRPRSVQRPLRHNPLSLHHHPYHRHRQERTQKSTTTATLFSGSLIAFSHTALALATTTTSTSPTSKHSYDNDDDDDTIYALSSGSSSSSSTATAVAVIRITGRHARPILALLLRQGAASLPPPRVATLRKLYRPTMDPPLSIHANDNSSKTTNSQTTNNNNHGNDKNILDQALVLYFPGPRSFTGQDCVELHCHGGRAVVAGVLDAIAAAGPILAAAATTTTAAGRRPTTTTPIPPPPPTTTGKVRLAEPGEFTARAFASGKLDLLQVEALADLLAADTSLQRTMALRQLDGRLSSQIYQSWRTLLIEGLAHAEAVLDFGDDERLDDSVFQNKDGDDSDDSLRNAYVQQEINTWGGMANKMQSLLEQMQEQLIRQNDRRGELIREGVKIAIVGPPNAGKSSLLNVLVNRPAAIVSPVAGTTRDVIEVALNLGGVKCLVQDTAGVRDLMVPLETGDCNNKTDTKNNTADSMAVIKESTAIEQEGISRAVQAARQADLIVAMVDAADPESGWSSIRDVIARMAATEDSTAIPTTTTIPRTMDSIRTSDLSTTSISDSVSSRMILVVNKSDLKSDVISSDSNLNNEFSLLRANGCANFDVSCVTQEGMEEFLQHLTKRVGDRVGLTSGEHDSANSASTPSLDEGLLITRARHRQHVQAAIEALERFAVLSQQGSMAVDMAAEELRLAASEIGRITGAVDVEDILDKLFSDFCIGK